MSKKRKGRKQRGGGGKKKKQKNNNKKKKKRKKKKKKKKKKIKKKKKTKKPPKKKKKKKKKKRYLWLEFQERIRDPHSEYFINFLGYAPDPVLSDNTLERLTPPEESPLPIDPDLIRVIAPGASRRPCRNGGDGGFASVVRRLGRGALIGRIRNSGLEVRGTTAVQAAG